MICPYCKNADTKVVDSRPVEDGLAIRRRRECEKCHRRFTTFEKIENSLLVVVKSNGIRESFDRNKLIKGMLKACEKTKVTYSDVEAIAEDIERTLSNSMEKEVEACKEQVAEKKGQTICPSCGAGVPKEASFCMYCGAPLPERKEEKTEDADFTEVPEDAFEPEDEPAGQKAETEEKEPAEREASAGETVHTEKTASQETSEEGSGSAQTSGQE